MKRVSIYTLLIIGLCLNLSLQGMSVSAEKANKVENKKVVLFTDNPGGEIELYDDLVDLEILTTILDDTTVELLNEPNGEEYSLIHIAKGDGEEEIKGYVDKKHIIDLSLAKEFRAKRTQLDSQNDPILTDDDKQPPKSVESVESVEQDMTTNNVTQKDADVKKPNTTNTNKTTDATIEDGDVEHQKQIQEPKSAEEKIESAKPLSLPKKKLRGVALKGSTNVYQSKSQGSKVLKSYDSGKILIFHEHEPDWYAATVYINSKPFTGYIHVDDVDPLHSSNTGMEGNAIKQPVSVYSSPTRQGKVLKSYNYSHVLKYRTFSSKWHEATVYVKGKPYTGYIHATDVDHLNLKPSHDGNENGDVPSVRGVALNAKTHVYSDTSKSAILKSYGKGHILKYRAHNSTWYKATVYLNGNPQTGYISIHDVETAASSQVALQGSGLKQPTRVYTSASKGSRALKTYQFGHKLKYRSFTEDWYEATVYQNGQRYTGYIHHQDVGERPATLQGYGTKSLVSVYSSNTNKNPKKLKSYSYGQVLKYQNYDNNWFIATVYLRGKAHKGFIHKKDVITNNGKVIVIDAGHGGKDPGASGIGFEEKDLVLDLSLRSMKLLERAGYTVIMTRTDDTFIELKNRAKIANDSKADLFLSIHGNSFNGAARGIETFWWNKHESVKSEQLANVIQNGVIEQTKSPSRGVKQGNFHVIRETTMPSALLEVGFVDNKQDVADLRKNAYKESLVNGILRGITTFLKLI